MPKNAITDVAQGVWTELTDADVTNVSFQNTGLAPVYVVATVGAVAPVSIHGAYRYVAGKGEANAALVDLWPGVDGGNRIWGWAKSPGSMSVSHA